MIIYLALIIPLLFSLFLYIFYKHKLVWWELFIPLICSFLFIVLSKLIIEKALVSSEEYWGSMIDRVEYYEDWNEYVHRTCSRTNCHGSGKSRSCHTTYYDCSFVRYHAPYWQLVTTTGVAIRISKSEYNKLKNKFNNEYFADLGRNYHTDDGDKYYSKWLRDSISATPVTTKHSYENRIKAADHSIFNFKNVHKDDIIKFGLKEYPQITGYSMVSVLGDSTNDALIANKKLNYINGLLGPKKQLRVFILVFKNQPISAGIYQEWYWVGGNKNEFVICIGIDNNRKVKWSNVFSWTRNELLKSEIKNFVNEQDTLNLTEIVNYSKDKLDKGFVRRSFKEFDYLTVEPPTWAVVLTFVLTIIINLGIAIWIVKNEFE